jgi:hypothetical protein
MSYFEVLRKPSPLHSVGESSDRSFTIMPAGDGDDSLRAFQRVVIDANAKAGDEYEVLPHPSGSLVISGWPIGRPVYDMATITLK